MKNGYNFIRASSIYIENLPYESVVKRKPKLNYAKEKVIIARLKRTWPISIRQYEELFWEKIYFSTKMKFFRVKEILSTLTNRFSNINGFLAEVIIYHPSNFKSVKLYHNYTNIENIIKVKKKHEIHILNVHFDDENINKVDGVIWNEFLRADWVLVKDDTIYFIETDMGNEKYSILKEKDSNYISVISQLQKKGMYKNYKVLLFTKRTRIVNLKKNNVMENLDSNSLIEYYEN